MAKKGGSDDGGSEIDAIRAEEAARQARIRAGTKKISTMFDRQFSPTYYDKQRDNYVKYANPQLTEQHTEAAKQLTFALDRRGALDSSSRTSLQADLQKQRALKAAEIKDTANSYRTDAMSNVENTRADLIRTLNATGDAEGAVNDATARATILSRQPAYSPLAAAFADFTAGLGQQAAAERAFSYGAGPRPTYQTGLFGAPSGSVVNS